MELYENKKMILQEFNWTSWLFAYYLILHLDKMLPFDSRFNIFLSIYGQV